MSHWKIKEPVFKKVLPKGSLYLPRIGRQYFQHILELIKQPQTLQLVYAPYGGGKTTFAKWVYGLLNPESYDILSIVTISSPKKPGFLLRRVNDFLIGREDVADDVLQACAKGFAQLKDENRQLVLLLDGADILGEHHGVEEVQSLLQVAATGGSRLSCLLLAQEEACNSLRQHPYLAKNLSYVCRLPQITRQEMGLYIEWYLKLADLNPNPFASDAIDAIYEVSAGIPGSVNALAENCLINGACQELSFIPRSLVMEMAGHMGPLPAAKTSSRAKSPGATPPVRDDRSDILAEESDKPISLFDE